MIPLTQFVTVTPEIQNLLIKLEGQKTAFDIIPKDPNLLSNYRRKSLLHSALYSARIEGNTLTPETFTKNSKKLETLEVQNLLDTYIWLSKNVETPLNLNLVKELHSRSMKNLRADAGHFRTEQNAVFNSAGVAIYLAPPPEDLTPLLKTWLEQLSSSSDHPLIRNLIAHYQFEKIHPFMDGNGRVGRLILTSLLKKSGHNFADLLGLEKLIADSRDDYYYYLAEENRDLTDFALYFLRLLSSATDTVIREVSIPNPTPKISLLPRRAELLATVTDHSPCSFDFLHRRFVAIAPSTLRYDLLQLQKAGLIKKLGNTRGALYSSTSFPE